jgi:hypothetical protein
MTPAIPESISSWLSFVGTAVPPRDPKDEEDEEDGGDADADREPAVLEDQTRTNRTGLGEP